MDFIFQKVNVYREKYAVLAKFYPINDKNKGIKNYKYILI